MDLERKGGREDGRETLNHTLGVGRGAHGRGSGGLPVAGSASLSIGLGLGGDSWHYNGEEPRTLCPNLHPLFIHCATGAHQPIKG